MPALAELEREWVAAREDPDFRARLDGLLATYVGRPSPLYHAERLSERVGSAVYLKREDLLHTGAHKINNALGQALLAQRMGKPRVIAETGAGQHGVATATACALLGLECVVYMGTEDMRRQRPNVERMGLLGAHGRAGRGRRAHAQGGGQRSDPRLGHERRDDALHHRLGGRPGAVPGAGARPAARDRRRGARRRSWKPRDACRTAWSRAWAAAATRSAPSPPSWSTSRSSWSASRRRARGSTAATARRSPPAARACCTARCPRSSRTRTARSWRRTRSPPASTIPGVGPEHAHLRDTGRVRYVSVTDDDAVAAFKELSRLEGIIPALEPVARDRLGAGQPGRPPRTSRS